MFNLDQAIKEWRSEMFAAGIKSSEALDELESHLRDDVEQQVRSGLSWAMIAVGFFAAVSYGLGDVAHRTSGCCKA